MLYECMVSILLMAKKQTVFSWLVCKTLASINWGSGFRVYAGLVISCDNLKNGANCSDVVALPICFCRSWRVQTNVPICAETCSRITVSSSRTVNLQSQHHCQSVCYVPEALPLVLSRGLSTTSALATVMIVGTLGIHSNKRG